MKKILVLAFAALAISAAGALASTDCCFDTALPPVNGNVVCVEQAGEAACHARAGAQIYAPQFDCPANNSDTCDGKTSGNCTVDFGGGISGGCTFADLVHENPAPGMSTMTLAILLTLLASAAVWMLARRRTGSALV